MGEFVDQCLFRAHLGHQANGQFPQLLWVEFVEVGRCIHAPQFARAGLGRESKLFTSLCVKCYTTAIAWSSANVFHDSPITSARSCSGLSATAIALCPSVQTNRPLFNRRAASQIPKPS